MSHDTSHRPKRPVRPIALVTGATSGIGRHAALHLAERGFRVIATGRRSAKLAELVSESRGEITPLVLDVTAKSSIAGALDAVHRITDDYGIDVLINNAGFGDYAPIELVGDEDLRAHFETNVFGLMAVTRAFLPDMRRRGSGRIINVSSLGGTFTLPLFGAYNATKYAVESLSDALRLELAPFGIQVSLIEPGPIRTDFTTRSLASADKYGAASSDYRQVVERFASLAERTDGMARGPIVTSRAIYHAASSSRPRPRYKLPFSSRLAVAVLSAMPTRMADALLRRIMGLDARTMALAESRPAGQLDATSA